MKIFLFAVISAVLFFLTSCSSGKGGETDYAGSFFDEDNKFVSKEADIHGTPDYSTAVDESTDADSRSDKDSPDEDEDLSGSDKDTDSGDEDVLVITSSWVQFGTGGSDIADSIAFDSQGYIYITGSTTGAFEGFKNAGGTCGSTTCSDIFLAKFSSSGSKLWIKQWGTASDDYGSAVRVDTLGNIFIAGMAGGSLEGAPSFGGADIFLMKLDKDGKVLWVKEWGTANDDWADVLLLDSSGNMFVAGYTEGDLDGNKNAGGQCVSSNCSDLFISRLNNAGEKQWTKQWGAVGNDWAAAGVLNSGGNIFITGQTQGSYEGFVLGGMSDLFVTKFNTDGVLSWTKQYGTKDSDSAYGIAFDDKGNLLVTGATSGIFEGVQLMGGEDVFLMNIDTGGSLLWTAGWGTSSIDQGRNIEVMPGKGVFVSGVTFGCFREGCLSENREDAFLTKTDLSGVPLWSEQLGDVSSREWARAMTSDSLNYIYLAGSTDGTMPGGKSAGGNDCFYTKVKLEN